jgi:AcrR family transcriptional regulator
MSESRDTRSALIASARKVFARRGYRGASIKAITDDAHANLGAVTYHFGTKERLYHEVIRQLVGPLHQHVRAATEADGTALSRIEAGVRAYFQYMHTHHELPAMMLHEMSLTGPLPAPIQESIGAMMKHMSGLVVRGQADGEIVEGDPVLLTVSSISQPLFFVIMRRGLKEIAGVNMHDRATQERVLVHLLAFVRRGLMRPGSSTQ